VCVYDFIYVPPPAEADEWHVVHMRIAIPWGYELAPVPITVSSLVGIFIDDG